MSEVAEPEGSETEETSEQAAGVPQVFGRQMKRFRNAAGLSRAQLGSRTGYSESTIASYEQGRRIPSAKFIRQVDEVLGAHEVLTELIEDMERAQFPKFFQDAAKLEKEAVGWHVYDALVINGLLQTEDYARAVFTMRRPVLDEETIEQRVTS